MILILVGFIPSALSTSFAAGDKPDTPGETLSTIEDHSSLETADDKTTSEDILYLNLLERPFTPVEMKYFGFIDISLAELSMDSHWVYIVITVEEPLPPESFSYYGVEVDIDIDDRGDVLVWATLPKDEVWTLADNVFVDENDDVGGVKPYVAEPPEKSWDGYDSDLLDVEAWIRRPPEDDHQIWMAFPIGLLEGTDVFVWSVYAQGNPPKQSQSSLHLSSSGHQEQPGIFFDQSKFHYNDFVHPKRAGSPIAESRFYPLGILAAVDNTCRQIFGATLDAPYPGFCGYNIQLEVTTEEPEPLDDVIYPEEDESPDPVPEPKDDDDPTPQPEPEDEEDDDTPTLQREPEEIECEDNRLVPCDDEQYPDDTELEVEEEDESGNTIQVAPWNPSDSIRDRLTFKEDED